MRNRFLTLAVSLLLAHTVSAQSRISASPSASLPGEARGQEPGQPTGAEAAQLNATVDKLIEEAKYKEALPLAERVLGIEEKTLGPDHPKVARALYILAVLYHAKGDDKQAGLFDKRAIAIWERAPATADPDYLRALERYACLKWKNNEVKEASEIGSRIRAVIALSKNERGVAGEPVKDAKTDRRPTADTNNGKQAPASGEVKVRILVDETGTVACACAMTGNPLLEEAAVQAAYRARFSPTLRKGVPVKVDGVISYHFVLQ